MRLLAAALLAWSAALWAQAPKFPTAPQPFARPAVLGPAFYKPEGEGPFPAAVISSTCAGIGAHLFVWAERLVRSGYVVVIPDHLGPRGRKFNCPMSNAVSVSEYAEDAFEALKFLRAQPYVDGKRVVQFGFSYGAMAGLRIASTSFSRKYLAGGDNFAAVVAMYPWCNEYVGVQRSDHMWNFFDDTETPLLVLLGGQDNEASPRSCVEKAKSNAARGLPVEWKIYEGATHLFDNAKMDGSPGFFQRAGNVYRGDAAVVEQAWQDTKAFLERRLAGR